MIFLNIQIDLIILETDIEQFTLTTKKSLHIIFKRLNEWKSNVENRGMRVNMNKTKVMISGERQKQVQKAARWPCGVCGRGVNSTSMMY